MHKILHYQAEEYYSQKRLPDQDWKNFLRLRITKDGLTLFPVGIDRVPRKWKEEGNRVEPDDPQATPPRIIEPEPVTVL